MRLSDVALGSLLLIFIFTAKTLADTPSYYPGLEVDNNNQETSHERRRTHSGLSPIPAVAPIAPVSGVGTQNLQAAASSGYGYGASAGDVGGYSSGSGGHSISYGGGGGGHTGYGSGSGGSSVSNSAAGLLGFLVLLTMLQNAINSMTSSSTTSGRRRRRDIDDNNRQNTTMLSQVPELMLPLMMQYVESTDADHHFHCIQRAMCITNKKLVNDFGATGRVLAHLISSMVVPSVDGSSLERHKMALEAARAGRNGVNCVTMYPGCDATLRPPFESQTLKPPSADKNRTKSSVKEKQTLKNNL